MSQNLKERIAVLQKEQEQLKVKAQKLQSQFNEKEKNAATRRKCIAGALVLKDIETNAGLRNHIIKLLGSATERDKKAFPDLLRVGPATPAN